MTSVSAGQIILKPTQPVVRERPERESNPRPPHQELRALPTQAGKEFMSLLTSLINNNKITASLSVGLRTKLSLKSTNSSFKEGRG